MLPLLTSLAPSLMTSLAPSMMNTFFKGGTSKTTTNRNQLMSMASQVLKPKTGKAPIVRPLPPPPSTMQRGGQLAEDKDDKTMLYVGLGAVAIAGILLLKK